MLSNHQETFNEKQEASTRFSLGGYRKKNLTRLSFLRRLQKLTAQLQDDPENLVF